MASIFECTHSGTPAMHRFAPPCSYLQRPGAGCFSILIDDKQTPYATGRFRPNQHDRLFQPGLPGWLSFDNKYKGGGVLEAAILATLQVRPLPPYLKPSSMGQLGVLGVCEVSVTNVKRDRKNGQNAQLPLLSKISLFHSPQVNGWLVIRCSAWLVVKE